MLSSKFLIFLVATDSKIIVYNPVLWCCQNPNMKTRLLGLSQWVSLNKTTSTVVFMLGPHFYDFWDALWIRNMKINRGIMTEKFRVSYYDWSVMSSLVQLSSEGITQMGMDPLPWEFHWRDYSPFNVFFYCIIINCK
jgi:hypothetical protein